jgi:hypothetical protein
MLALFLVEAEKLGSKHTARVRTRSVTRAESMSRAETTMRDGRERISSGEGRGETSPPLRERGAPEAARRCCPWQLDPVGWIGGSAARRNWEMLGSKCRSWCGALAWVEQEVQGRWRAAFGGALIAPDPLGLLSIPALLGL